MAKSGKSSKMPAPSTTELTGEYISEHPSIADCLKKGVVNYSKLSRRIAKELGIEKQTSLDAILIACRRYSAKYRNELVAEEVMLNILRKSELEIKNKVVVAIVSRKIYMGSLMDIEKKIRKSADFFYAIEGKNYFTVIIPEKYLEEFNQLFEGEIRKVAKDLAMVTIKSPEEMESTPGVVAYIYSRLGEHGINIVETMSCWTDTILVLSEDDIPMALKYLKF
ncbi:MAG: hypothetical protein NT157_05880 [Candidatus Micrarchaeota archaeon]|nr:hypothetical protein [Candidatus Micrarchaeota archaeon]